MRLISRLLGAATPLVAARLISAVLTFGLPLMLVRLLDARAYGAYKQFFLLTTTVLLVGQCGLTQSLYYFLPRRGPARGSFLLQAVGLLWLAALLLGSGLWLAAPRVTGWFGAAELVPLRTPLAVTAALMLAAAPLEAALTADGNIGAAALAYVVGDGLRAGAMVAAALWLGPAAIFWAAAAVTGARLAALIVLIVVRVLPSAPPARERLRAQLRFALPFAGASLFFVGQRYCAQYLVSARVDAATFPVFTVGSFHLPVVDIVFTPVTEVLMVALGSRLGGPRALDCWNQAVNKLAAILFPATAGAFLLGGAVLPLLFTARYRAAVPIFYLATLEIPFCILPGDALLRAAGDTRFLFWFNAVRVAVTVALVALGLRLGSLAGAMVGAVGAEAIGRVGLLVRGRRFLGAGPLLDWPFLARIGVASALACLPALAVGFLLPRPLLRVPVAVVVYGVSYLALTRRNTRLSEGSMI